MDGIAEGTEPSPSDKATADRQVEDGEIDALGLQQQNATPDVKRPERSRRSGRRCRSPRVTETLTPEGASFQALDGAGAGGHRRRRSRGAGGRMSGGRGGERGDHADRGRRLARRRARSGRGSTSRSRRGEFVAVLGPNGAGKSTFLDVVLGLLAPSAGGVSVLGDGAARRPRPDRLPAAAAQLRRLDPGARRDVVRPRARRGALGAAAARRLSALGPRRARQGRRGGRRWSAPAPTPSARSARSPAASSSGC